WCHSFSFGACLRSAEAGNNYNQSIRHEDRGRSCSCDYRCQCGTSAMRRRRCRCRAPRWRPAAGTPSMSFSSPAMPMSIIRASLCRLAHYDYWSDTVRRSIVLDAKADLLGYGMGEKGIVDIATRLAAGQTVRDLRDMRGVAYTLGASETPPTQLFDREVLRLPSYEEVKADKWAFAEATRLIHIHTNPFNAQALVQYH